MTSNTQKLNKILFNTWNGLLKSDLEGNKKSFEKELNDLRNDLLKKNPSLNKLNRGLEKLLGNDFFKKSMGGCYKKHQQKLAKIRKELSAVVTRKKKVKKNFRSGYYNFFMSLSGAENSIVDPERDSSRAILDEFIEDYSNVVFLKNFADISALKAIVEDIYAEVTSVAFFREIFGGVI